MDREDNADIHWSPLSIVGSILVYALGDRGSNPGGVDFFSILYWEVRGALIPREGYE